MEGLKLKADFEVADYSTSTRCTVCILLRPFLARLIFLLRPFLTSKTNRPRDFLKIFFRVDFFQAQPPSIYALLKKTSNPKCKSKTADRDP